MNTRPSILKINVLEQSQGLVQLRKKFDSKLTKYLLIFDIFSQNFPNIF